MTGQFRLRGTAGSANSVDPADSRAIKRALQRLGVLDGAGAASGDFMDRATLAGLKVFQGRNGLIPDGIAKSGGPTERLLAAALAERDGGPSGGALDLSDSVGETGANRPGDVRATKRALAALGYVAATRAPAGRFDDDLALGIRAFQRDFNLKRDGLLHPGGNTARTLDRVVRPAVLAARVTAAAPVTCRRRRPEKAPNHNRTPIEPPSQAFMDKWAKRGFGGPRGPLHVPTLRNCGERTENVLTDKPARFNIEANPDADASSPPHEIESIGVKAIEKFGRTMEEEARKQNVNPDLVKAISFSENARGHYFGMADVFEWFGLAKSIFPMNIRPDIWSKLSPSKVDLTDPQENIRAGVILIKRLRDRIEDPTPEKVATLWHSLSQEEVTDFGAYVGRMFREKPWER